MSLVRLRLWAPFAVLAHLVERHLAKVEVASSSLVARSRYDAHTKVWASKSKKNVDIFKMFAYNINDPEGDIAKW